MLAVFSAAAAMVPAGGLYAQAGKTVAITTVVQEETFDRLMVSLEAGVDANRFAQTHGLGIVRQFVGVENTWLFRAPGVESAGELAGRFATMSGVLWAFQDRASAVGLSSFVPNDPLFNNPPPPNSYGGQWHLGNSLGSLPNINVAGAWAANITGAGVMIGIVDTGVEPGHEDLSANFSAANTYDFVANSPSQNLLNQDVHGTLVAGVAGARGGNGLGVSGSAPYAGISSQKIFQGNLAASAAGITNAILFNCTGSSPAIQVKNHSYFYRNPYAQTSAQVAAVELTAASGTIHVFAGGNERGAVLEDANKMHLQNSPHQIAVAALGSDHRFASYSSFGANITVTAPSHSWTPGTLWITTTDRSGNIGLNQNGVGDYSNLNYTSGMGGTSSSAPLVAGVMALGKQVNPGMDVRLAKHALARSSVIVDPTDVTATSDGGWRTNAAGFHFNQNYGFGLVDASAFVNLVAQGSVSPLVVAATGTVGVGAAIADGDLTGITRTAFNGTSGTLEEVLVDLDITHTFRGDLEAWLASPSGYTSRLFYRSDLDDGDVIDWTFSTNAFWGEQAMGTWSLTVRDTSVLDTGTWNSFAIHWRMGDYSAVPEPGTGGLMALCLVAGLLVRRFRK